MAIGNIVKHKWVLAGTLSVLAMVTLLGVGCGNSSSQTVEPNTEPDPTGVFPFKLESVGEATLTVEAQPRDCTSGEGPWKCLVAKEAGGEPYFIYSSIRGFPTKSGRALSGFTHDSGCELKMVVKVEKVPDKEVVTSGNRLVRTLVREIKRDCEGDDFIPAPTSPSSTGSLLGEHTFAIESAPRDCSAGFGPWRCLVAQRSGASEPEFIYETIGNVPNLPEDKLNGYNHTSGCEFTWVIKVGKAFDGEPPIDAFPYDLTFVREIGRDCG